MAKFYLGVSEYDMACQQHRSLPWSFGRREGRSKLGSRFAWTSSRRRLAHTVFGQIWPKVPFHRLVTQTRFSLRSNLVCSTHNNLKIVWTDCTKEFLAFLRQFLHFPSLLLYSWGGFDWSPLCQRASSPISDGDIAFLVGFKKSRVLAFQALRCCCCQNECFLSSHENEKYFDLFHLILSLA